MGRTEFIKQIEALGYKVEQVGESAACFPYVVPVGRFAGQEIKLGFIVPNDFPMTPPSGPHISPGLLPLNTSSNIHPAGGIHPSPTFGDDWEYWSRPFSGWNESDRTMRSYMAHIRHLFDTQ